MSFIGLVTRKEKDTGVTLLAKIVTPSKKKSAKKAFKVKVKANALDDYSCCVIDHATVKSRLENSQDLTGMIEDIVLSYNGVNGTTISYEINDKPNHTPKLTDYLSEDGKIIGRPKYNPNASSNAEGTLTIIVTKGNAEVRSNLQIAVKGYTAEEVFAQGSFTKQKIWQTICGSNKPDYSDAYNLGGNNNITSPLNFVSEMRCDDISTVPITITYSLVDDLIPYIPKDGKYENDTTAFLDENGEKLTSRINPENGKIYTLSFAAAAYMCNNVNFPGSMITTEAMVSERRVRISGLHITANLSLGDNSTPRVIILDCSVMSKKLTNQEIFTNIIEKNFKYFLNDVQMDFDNATPVQLNQVGSNNTCELKFMNQDICTTFQYADFGIKQGELTLGIRFSYSIRDSSNNNYDAITAPQVFANYSEFNAGTADSTGFYCPLLVDFSGMKNVSVDMRTFAVQCDISVSGFTVNGESSIGSPVSTTKIAKFAVNVGSGTAA